MMPLSAVWAGPERNDHLDGAAAALRADRGLDAVPLLTHVGDVGHTLIVGPTGAGKSVLLALIALQFRRYPGAQVFVFDKGGSVRPPCSAMGGDWHDLGGALADESAQPSPSSRWRASTMPASAPGRRSGSRRCSPAKPSR